jgi:hypothetical protein
MTTATGSVKHEQLKYNNVAFAVHHLIADCPPKTVIRELLKNAEESAAEQQPAGRIEFFKEVVRGAPKLGLFNEGPGMSADDLADKMNLASTGKTLGVDNNFGQGGKISALRVSPHGVIYRSCKGGRVCQIILGVDAAESRKSGHPVYAKIRQRVQDASGDSFETVIDVTESYAGRPERPLDRDWTEVVLLGGDDAHDTVAELIPGQTAKNWLLRGINTRFYRFPLGVVVRQANITTDQVKNRNAAGLEEVTLNFCRGDNGGRYEDVAAIHPRFGPVTLRYCKLAGRYGEDAAGNSRASTMDTYGLGRGGHACLVWKDECYDVQTGWSRISGAFGVTFGSSNVAVHILLPEGAPVKNNTYRDNIIDRHGDHQVVRVEEFAELVRSNRPQWLVDYIEEEARKNTNPAGVMHRLKEFLEGLKADGEPRPAVEPGGDDQGELPVRPATPGKGNGGGSGGSAHDPSSNQHRPSAGRRVGQNGPGIPDVRFTTDCGHLDEMTGRAALYRRAENVILLNPHYELYRQYLDRLYADAGPDADRRALAKQLFDEEYCFNAGRFVVQAWLFKGKADWSDEDWEKALDMGTLTVHLVDPRMLDEARRRFRMKLNARKMENLVAN